MNLKLILLFNKPATTWIYTYGHTRSLLDALLVSALGRGEAVGQELGGHARTRQVRRPGRHHLPLADVLGDSRRGKGSCGRGRNAGAAGLQKRASFHVKFSL